MMWADGRSDEAILADLAELCRDRCRTPMQWTQDANAGFAPADVATWLPLHDSHLDGVDAASQRSDPGSILNFHPALIGLRRGSSALSSGSFEVVDEHSRESLAFRRQADDETVLVIVNFVDHAVTVAHYTSGPRVRFGSHPCPEVLDHTTTLDPIEVLVCGAPTDMPPRIDVPG